MPREAAATPSPEEVLRGSGLRLTPQRILVVEALANAVPAHLSADDV